MTTINSGQELHDATFQKYVNKYVYQFNSATFNIAVTVSNTSFVEFIDCVFNEDVKFSGKFEQPVNIQGCTFSKKASFNNADFEGKVRIQRTKFLDAATFNNTKFKDLCDFWNTSFQVPTIFYKTDFNKTVVFSRAVFQANVLFTYTLIDKTAIFRAAEFKKGLDFSTAIINGTLNLFDFKLNDFEAQVKFNEDDFEEMVGKKGIIPEKNKRETFRIIKKQFETQNNHVLSLDFKALELKSEYNDLKSKIFTKHGKMQNIFILLLNKTSNDNGKSWFRAIIFTFLVSLLFFYLTIINTENYKIGVDVSNQHFHKMGKLFFEFMTPTHKVDFLNSENATFGSYFFDFWGRVFVAYGIYQTIQAFRKYRT